MPNRRRSGRFKKRLPGERGFTLIEIMVAVLLLLFAMAGIVPFFLGGLSQASTVRYKSIATNIARERMEEIRQLDYREITEDAAEGVTLTDRFGTGAVQRDINFDISYLVEEASYEEGTLKKVTVNVGWNAPPTVSAAAITTLIHQQFLGPRGSYLELTSTEDDPLGTPFPRITGTTRALYHIAQADWNLVYNNLDEADMTPRGVYLRLALFDDSGHSITLGEPGNEYRIDNSHLRYELDADGKIVDVWFESETFNNYASIPDGYWELRAVAYNEYDQPGNIWRQIVRVENGVPAAPAAFTASPQLDNQTVIVTWTGGAERDRAYYVLQRTKWDGDGWSGGWVTLADNLAPNAVSYTDQGSIGAELDPWGTAETSNRYLYRIWAVDICDPGNVGAEASTEAWVPPAVITTTTTLTPPSTVSTSTTSTTEVTEYSVNIRNSSNKAYNLNVRDAGGTLIFTGSVGKNSTRTLSGLSAGNYQITATSSGRPTLVQSFSLPAQAGQVVMDIL